MVLCVHPEGSHVIEAFLKGTVDMHKKKRLLKILKGHFLKVQAQEMLACAVGQ